MELLAGTNDRKFRIGEVVSNPESHVLISFMKMTWFHAMELVKEARLPCYPLGGTHCPCQSACSHKQSLQILRTE